MAAAEFVRGVGVGVPVPVGSGGNYLRSGETQLDFDPARIGAMGCSAGANLSATFCSDARLLGEEPLGTQILIYAVVEMYTDPADKEAGTLLCEPHAALMPDGSILCAIRVQNYTAGHSLFTVYLCRSTDGGATFSAPQTTGWDGSPPQILVTKSGTVVMTYARRRAPFAECARLSYDSGATWSEELVLVDTAPTGDIGYPCTAENEKGELVTIYYQHNPGQGSQIYSIIWTVD